jgi:regulator of sigma E protease
MLNLIYFVIVLSILIFVHELGHFLIARLTKVKVLTFSLGFGKKLLKFKRGETEYAVSVVPLGGYVKMLGESSDDEISEEDSDRAFSNKSPGIKLLIAFSGPFFNILFAALVFFVMFMTGYPTPSETSKVGEIMKGEAADVAGLKTGDVIRKINGQPVSKFTEIYDVVSKAEPKPMKFVIDRDGKEMELWITPKQQDQKNVFGEIVGKTVRIGVGPAIDIKKETVLNAFPQAVMHTADVTVLTVVGFGKLIKGSISPKNVGGPILIFQQVGKQAKMGFTYFLQFLALISINLGIVNLLPIPILDGGHILFSIIELVVRRKIPETTVEVAQKVGLGILICIMVLATFNDITRFFTHGR